MVFFFFFLSLFECIMISTSTALAGAAKYFLVSMRPVQFISNKTHMLRFVQNQSLSVIDFCHFSVMT